MVVCELYLSAYVIVWHAYIDAHMFKPNTMFVFTLFALRSSFANLQALAPRRLRLPRHWPHLVAWPNRLAPGVLLDESQGTAFEPFSWTLARAVASLLDLPSLIGLLMLFQDFDFKPYNFPTI